MIVIVSEYPFYDYMKDIVRDFYDHFKSSKGINNLLEAYVFNLVFRITVPQRDQKSIRYNFLSAPKV